MQADKILLVEDDSSSRNFLRRILVNKGFSVTSVNDGYEALIELKKVEYPIVITDWLMPKFDGIELIEKIRKEFTRQPVIILLTAISSIEAKERAISAGADEYLAKPIDINNLLQTIQTLTKKENYHPSLSSRKKFEKTTIPINYICVGITASTGGPPTLSKFFEELGAVNHAYFLVVQHGPEWMLESFVKSIQSKTSMPTRLGKDGLRLLPGRIYIAPGGKHMIIKNNSTTIGIVDTSPVNFVKPSADPLFKSIASVFGKYSIGIVLTGMGYDGSYGSGYISAAGGKIIVQEPSTCILPSMPSGVINLKLADHIIPLPQLAKFIREKIDEIYSSLHTKN
jgi:two-component system chemotaxis response regulator CheB